ncbi:MAG: hypothetical protein HQ522_19795 [Bacteroidetes bacterium]|nr:hypothetical protein [Bacteroidota bacterium]
MKKEILITLSLLTICNLTFTQITTSKVADKKEEISNQPYDSLINFLGKDVYQYVGQELYLKGKSESLRKYGYTGFFTDYTKSKQKKGVVYKCCESYNSKYDELAGKYFDVITIHKHPKAKESEYLYGKKFFLELIAKESGDRVYYEYDSQYKHSFPFIIVGFFIKQKELNIGREIVVRGKNWVTRAEPMLDMNTGKPVSFEVGSIWKCVDFTVEEKYYTLSLVLENDKGEKIPLSFDNVDNTHFVFDARKAELYKKMFGQEKWDKILNGRVVVGFTEEMVLLSWGKPEKINKASYGDQWVYDGQYIYFENGILSSFN